MALAAFTFVAVFLLIASGTLLLFFRQEMAQRLSAALSPRAEGRRVLRRLKIREAGSSLGAFVQQFEKVLPKNPKEVSVAQKRMILAGYRSDRAVRISYGCKVLIPIALVALVAATGLGQRSPLAYMFALVLGFMLPDFWLGRKIKSRQLEIRLGLPNALDLIVVCVEAGLSLDHAILRTSEELKEGYPEICDELGLVSLEQRAGRPRVDAWRNLAERTDVDTIRALVAVLIQADQFGTSIARTLRMYAEGLRVKRRQSVEEKAAKTTVKLVFPLVLFIFPSLFIVTAGPSMIALTQFFANFSK